MSLRKTIKHCLGYILVAGFAAGVASNVSAADDAAPQGRIVVATVFSKPIYADELEPGASEKLPSGLTDAQRIQWQASQRNERLSGMILKPLIDQYCQSHACEPTDEEIASFTQNLERSKQRHIEEWKRKQAALTAERQSPNVSDVQRKQIDEELKQLNSALTMEGHFYDGITPEQRATIEASRPAREREIARMMIRAWKLNKALYDEYGGSVIFQQAGIEPLGAYRAWLEAHEGKGDFQILEPTLRTAFWAYFVSTGHNFIPIDKFQQETGLKSPFEKPWWLMDKKPEKTP